MLNFCSWKSDVRKMSFSSTRNFFLFGSTGHHNTEQQDEENNETREPLPIGQLAILGMNQCQTKRTTLATPTDSGTNDLEPKWLKIKKIHPCCPLIPAGVHVRPCCHIWWCTLCLFLGRIVDMLRRRESSRLGVSRDDCALRRVLMEWTRAGSAIKDVHVRASICRRRRGKSIAQTNVSKTCNCHGGGR